MLHRIWAQAEDSSLATGRSEPNDQLLRQYAAGEISWTSLRRRGFNNYRDVLAGLGRLHLRPPMAPMDGPNVEARRRARAVIRSALQQAQG